MQESLDFVIVDDECDCGCDSLRERDTRFPEQDHTCSHGFTRSSGGATTRGLVLGSDGRWKYLAIYTPNQGRLPSAEDLEIRP